METADKTPPLQVELKIEDDAKVEELPEIAPVKKLDPKLNGINLIKNEYESEFDRFDCETDDIDLNLSAENNLKNGAVFHPKKLKNKASLRARGKSEDSEEETSTGKKKS